MEKYFFFYKYFCILILCIQTSFAQKSDFPYIKHKVKNSDNISEIIKTYNIGKERLDILDILNPGLFKQVGRKKIAYIRKFKYLKIPYLKKKVKKNHYEVFAGLSLGFFQEVINNNQRITQNQNTLYSLGGSYSYHFHSQEGFLNSRFYFSQFNSTKQEDGSKVRPKPEIGFSFHHVLENMITSSISPYYGLDFERFNIFNTDELLSDSENKIEYFQHYTLYITIGSYIDFSFIKEGSKLQLSMAYSSLNSSGGPYTYKGLKYYIEYNHKLYKTCYLGLFHKGHILKGIGTLNIRRTGFNIFFRF